MLPPGRGNALGRNWRSGGNTRYSISMKVTSFRQCEAFSKENSRQSSGCAKRGALPVLVDTNVLVDVLTRHTRRRVRPLAIMYVIELVHAGVSPARASPSRSKAQASPAQSKDASHERAAAEGDCATSDPATQLCLQQRIKYQMIKKK